MCAQKKVRIIVNRDQAAERCQQQTRSRSAELESRSNQHGGAGGEARPIARTQARSPKRPRTLAPMRAPGLSLLREAQEFELIREQTELSQVLSSFASDGASRHGRTVDESLDRIREELLPPTENGARRHTRLPANGTRVVLTGMNKSSNFNGREAVVVDKDGMDRVMVQVCGASELCRLSVRVQNMAVVEEPGVGESYEVGRDFSRVHELATLHARQNAKREVERLHAEVDERRRIMEQAARADTLMTNSRVVGVDVSMSNRQRCRYGNKCAKPDCMDLHPWEADWVEMGANSGCDSKAKFKAAKGIYQDPVPRGKVPQQKQKGASVSSPNRGKDFQMTEAAMEINRILAQAGVPVAARQAAHKNVIPLLCSHSHSMPSVGAPGSGDMFGQPYDNAADRLGKGRLGGVRALRADQRQNVSTNRVRSRTQAPHPTRPSKSLQQLQREQESLHRSINGVHEEEEEEHSIETAPKTASHAHFSQDDVGYESPRRPSWRDLEDPERRRQRINQLVHIRKAQLRKKKLVQENAMLHEALVACGAALSDPLLTISSPSSTHPSHARPSTHWHNSETDDETRGSGASPHAVAPIKLDRGRRHVPAPLVLDHHALVFEYRVRTRDCQ